MFKSSALTETPWYGVDAPGVARGLLTGGVVLAVAGGIVLARVEGAWRLAGWPLVLGAAVLLALGLSMLFYAVAGKHQLRDHLLRQRIWRGDEAVVDIGAGRGLMAVGAAQRVPTGRVIAIDLWSTRDLSGHSPDNLRRNAVIEKVEGRIEIVTADARTLDLPDASVDAVVSVFCLHNIEPAAARDAACREIARVLKPAGHALIADFPGTASYVAVFRAAGLDVAGPFRGEPVAFSICGYLVATKLARTV